MVEKDPDLWKLNRTRVFIIVMLLIALGLSVTTIVGSLNGWSKQDVVGAP